MPNISPHQLSNNGPQHTLPPLQPQQHAIMYQNGSATQSPRTPATPNTPGGSGVNMNYGQQPQPRSYQPMNNGQYQQQNAYAPSTRPMLPQTSAPMSMPQNIAPAPHRIQTLAPMPPNMHMQNSMQNPYGQHMPQQLMDNMEPPTHVVGSQGRRGILPSAPGRPAVPQGPGGAALSKTMIPAKDADGKFPCPHCTKTYLHAKHLKRHLLRRKNLNSFSIAHFDTFRHWRPPVHVCSLPGYLLSQ